MPGARGQRIWILFLLLGLVVSGPSLEAAETGQTLDLGLSAENFQEGKIPEGWTLRKRLVGPTRRAKARWTVSGGQPAVMLHSRAALTFLEKRVNIDLRQFPVVSWRWKVENVLEGINEKAPAGDDHPIRIFFVFEPDASRQSLWFRLKRFLYLDRFHGHAMGGRITEYLWSSHLPAREILPDPGKPWQKLMVLEGGREKLGQWLSYRRNLYEDVKNLYGEEPRRLIFIGILNDTDSSGLEAVSYIADLRFHKARGLE